MFPLKCLWVRSILFLRVILNFHYNFFHKLLPTAANCVWSILNFWSILISPYLCKIEENLANTERLLDSLVHTSKLITVSGLTLICPILKVIHNIIFLLYDSNSQRKDNRVVSVRNILQKVDRRASSECTNTKLHFIISCGRCGSLGRLG